MPRRQELQLAIEILLEQQLPEVPKPQVNWLDAGMDSLEVIEVCLKLEQSLGQEIPVEKFALEMTTDGLIDFLMEELPSA